MKNRTLTNEEVVLNWAIQNKISKDSIEKLLKEGFTSMATISGEPKSQGGSKS